MKLSIAQLIPAQYQPGVMREVARRTEDAVNLHAEGRLVGRHFTAAAIPTTGSFAQGDIVWDSAPAEAGVALSKYVRLGWICTVAGTPGTLLEMRVLTGN